MSAPEQLVPRREPEEKEWLDEWTKQRAMDDDGDGDGDDDDGGHQDGAFFDNVIGVVSWGMWPM